MADKQIIIDGVPVQDCCYFDYENDGYKDSCYIHQNECSAQNCYYKQLKRKEQECEELKEQYKWYDHYKEQALYNKNLCNEKSWEIGNLGYKIKNQRKEINKLQQQFDQLKAELEQEKALKETYLACYKAKHEDIEGKLFKLSKTLTEIKEIAETCMQQEVCFACDYYDNCYIEDEEIPTYDVCKVILQKISEVEND